MRVSEKVTIQEINKWQEGDIITIKAGCGAGKSYFIKNNLYAIAKRDNQKILMLIHRSNCTEQFIAEIENDDASKFNTITIATYQSLESKERLKGGVNLKEYDYIISDEFHYFISDAGFNKFTDMSLDIILNASHAKRIFMSATGNHMANYIINHKKLTTKHYELPIDFSFINHFEFYHSNTTLHSYIKLAIENNTKAVFFIQSAKEAYELHKQYEQYTLFNCSKSNKEYSQFVDEKKIKAMLENERFEELILITTLCFDAGANLKMPDLHDIVVDAGLDVGVIQQCIGRKRFDEKYPDDYLNVYIKSMSNKQLGGKETQFNKKIEMADYFLKHGANAMIDEFYREIGSVMIYDEVTNFGHEKKLNKLMYFNVKVMLSEIEIMKTYGDWGFCKYVADYFNVASYNVAEKSEKKSKLEIYLEQLYISKTKLDKEGQKQLIEKVDLRVNGRMMKSYKKLNDALKMIKLPYVIESETDNRRSIIVDGEKVENPNFRKVSWFIGKIVF